MAGMTLKEILNAKARAATLVESLVAMVIVLMSFGIALMIYVNIADSSNSQLKLNAHLTLSEALTETIQDEAYIDEETKKGILTIVKTVQPCGRSGSLVAIHLEAKDGNGKVWGVLDKIASK